MKHLTSELPIMVNPQLAARIGINQAAIVQRLQFLIQGQELAGNKYVFERGYYWVYNTYEKWQEGHFPWLSVSSIKRLFLELEEMGLIVSIQSVKDPSDREKWYRINVEQWDLLVDTIGPKRDDASDQNDTTIGLKKDDGISKNTSKNTSITTGRRSTRRDLLKHIPAVTPSESPKAVLRIESAGESSLARLVAAQFGKEFTIDKTTAEMMLSVTNIKENGVTIKYESVVDMYNNREPFKVFVAKRIAALKSIHGMTPLNAIRNICKIGLDPSVEGNEKKMPGYHFWLKSNEATVAPQEVKVVEFAAPPD